MATLGHNAFLSGERIKGDNWPGHGLFVSKKVRELLIRYGRQPANELSYLLSCSPGTVTKEEKGGNGVVGKGGTSREPEDKVSPQ